MLWKRQRKESQKQSLELPHKPPMSAGVSHFRHTIYSKYSAHYFYNIALYPLRFSRSWLSLGHPVPRCYGYLVAK